MFYYNDVDDIVIIIFNTIAKCDTCSIPPNAHHLSASHERKILHNP